MTLRSFLFVGFLGIVPYLTQAQAPPPGSWVMEIYVTGSLTTCSNFFANPQYGVNFNGNVASSSSYDVSMTLYQTHGNFSGTISASGSGNCECTDPEGMPVLGCTPAFASAAVTLAVAHSDSDPQTCQGDTKVNTANGFFITVSYKIYKMMDAPTATPVGSCGGSFTLFSPSVAPSYLWEVTDNPVNNNWQLLSGMYTQSISVTAANLNFPGFTGNMRYARVREGSGCPNRISAVSASFSITLPAPTAVSAGWTEPQCYGYDNGEVTINSITGQANNYLVTLQMLDPVSNTYGNAFQKAYASTEFPVTITKTTINNQFGVSGIKDGKWRLTVANNQNTSTLGACAISVDRTIVQPTDIIATLTPSNYNTFGVKCNGDNNGSVSVSVSQGTPGYTYLWSTGHTGASISSLTAQTYSVTVTDAKGCKKSPSATLLAPNPLAPVIATDKTPLCAESADGRLIVTTTGGAPGTTGYSYVWSNGATGTIANNLVKGDYSVTVTDANGCSTSKTGTLGGPNPIIVTLNATSPTCPDGTNGRVWVSNVQNAPGAVQYLWNTNENTFELLNIPEGTYSVIVSSVNGTQTCRGTASRVVADPIPWTAQIEPVLQYNGKAIKCNGDDNGRLNVTVRNDLGQVTDGEFYTWSTGQSGAAVKFIEDLVEGNYDVTVKYRGGMCEAKGTFVLMDPEPVVATIVGNSDHNGQLISCRDKTDASLKVNAGGGTGLPSSFSYVWNTTATGTTISGIGAGKYYVAVKDLNDCEASDTFTIDNPSQVQAHIFSASDHSGYGVSCKGEDDGVITAGGTGGTNVFSYLWSNSATTARIEDLVAGTYEVTVSDNNGCFDKVSHTLTSPEELTLQIADYEDIACHSGITGSVELEAGGGAPQYWYSKDSTVWQLSATFDLLAAGDYKLHVRDNNQCHNKVDKTLTQPDAISISFADVEPAYCADPRGVATGVVTGGVGGYRYEWRADGQSHVLSTSDKLTNVSAGIYDLFVIDDNDCPMDASVPITSTDGAKTAYTSVDAKCHDSSDGTARIEITEGDGPFVIQWPDNQNTLEGTNLKRGDYHVLITDGHDCTVIQTVTVNAPEPIGFDVELYTVPTCHTFCDGKITLQATGGVGSYAYTWNNQSNRQQESLCAGTYPVVIMDANLCTFTRDVVLVQPAAITAQVIAEKLPTCKDGCDGALQIAASGGNGGYVYSWANGTAGDLSDSLCPASYDVSIVDAKGCTGEGTFALHNTPPLPVNLGGAVTLCVGQTYTLDAGSQWTSVTWKGSNGLSASGQTVTIKDDGQYWVEVISKDGCVGQDTFLLQTSTELLQAEFFLASQAMVGDTIVMVDVSWPLPETIEWRYPQAMKKLVDDGAIIYGQFIDAGTYEVVLKADLGECHDEMAKTITILQNEEEEPIGGRLGYEQFVKEFILYPNPNDGSFDVSVSLAEESAITLSVWHSVTSRNVGLIRDRGKKDYRKHVDLRPLGSGAYVLRLDHDKGHTSIRFIVH